MKRIFVGAIAAFACITVFADYTGPGYYRVQNFKTSRWISVIDDKASIDYGSTTADLSAIQLQKYFDVVCSDPASILYLSEHSGEYDIEAQGTGIHKMIGHYLGLEDAGTSGGVKQYFATGSLKGVKKYIGDNNFMPDSLGYASTIAKNDYRKWNITPLSDDGDCFFGIKPVFQFGTKHYATMLGSFSFSTYSPGVKVYYVKTLDNGMAVLDELTGTVASDVPVIFECTSADPSTNRLHIGGSGKVPEGSVMKGAYFKNDVATHLNRVAYDPATMRVLGVTSTGKLGFITKNDLSYIPANTAYIVVPVNSPAEYVCVTRAEYEAMPAGIEDIVNDGDDSPKDVYTLGGVCVLRSASKDQISSLSPGIYVVNGKKIAVTH